MVVDNNPNSLQEIIQSQDEGRGRIQALRLFHDMFGMEPESTISRGRSPQLAVQRTPGQ